MMTFCLRACDKNVASQQATVHLACDLSAVIRVWRRKETGLQCVKLKLFSGRIFGSPTGHKHQNWVEIVDMKTINTSILSPIPSRSLGPSPHFS